MSSIHAVLQLAQPIRSLSSKIHLARGKRIRYGGGIPGARFGGKLSVDMNHRTESVLESIRTPKPVVNPIKRWKILRGDVVEVISGPEKGKRGRVIEAVRASNRVVVEGVQMVKKYVPMPESSSKKMVLTEAPIYVSRVAVICPETDKPTRIGYRFLEDGTKVRVSKKSGAIIPRPEILRQRRKPKPETDGKKDTAPTVVMERTFCDEEGLYNSLGGFATLMGKTDT